MRPTGRTVTIPKPFAKGYRLGFPKALELSLRQRIMPKQNAYRLELSFRSSSISGFQASR